MILPIDIIVESGTSVTIVVPEMLLVDGKEFTLKFCLSRIAQLKLQAAQGTEQVYIQNGVGDSAPVYPLINKLGNLFYRDCLRKCWEYCIAYGHNGLPNTAPHFINFNTPRCAVPIDPANAPVTVP